MRAARAGALAALVAAAAGTAGGGPAVAADEDGRGMGRIAYADGALTLDAGAAAPTVIEASGDGSAPGWDTTGVPAGALVDDTVRWALDGVDGPGEVRVRGADGPLFDSGDDVPDVVEVPVGGRAETDWEFSEPGTYRLIFSAAATSADGRELSTGTVYTVRVAEEETGVPEPSPSATEEEAPERASSVAPSPAAPRTLAQAAAPVRAAAAAEDDDVRTEHTVLGEGHIDFAARVLDGTLQLHVKDGTVPGRTVWREPSALELRVKPAARNTLPPGGQFAFLGKAGDPVWLLDQVQQEGLLWPGWSTDHVAAGALRGGVEFTLAGADGPGSVALYTYDAMSGATVLFNSKDGVPDSFDVPANSHAHGGWAFTKEGTYRLTFRMSGTLANGRAVSDTVPVTFVVGDRKADVGGGKADVGGGKADVGGGGADPSASPSSSSSPSGGGTGSGSGSDGSGSGGSSVGGDGSMAHTGAGDPVRVAAVAGGLALAGGAAVWGVRRRRGRTS
ncbi:choice-of-anchor M domain-containing protein [Streptomyces sp. NPDC096205]|uniref:choice-of-anchor M domain-containing protein n=1 Tax=Streptomyces sp. NPDC096205 TaxID=3366081 RepID=UPI00382E9DD0